MRGILLTKLNFLWSKKLASLLFATFFFNNNFGFLPTHNINQKKSKKLLLSGHQKDYDICVFIKWQ